MSTFNISIPGNICCFEKGNKEIAAGDTLLLTLDPVKYPNLSTETVDAYVNFMTPDGEGVIYNVTVDDSQMPVVNGFPLGQLDFSDIIAWACKSCCDKLEDRIDVIEEGLVTRTSATGVSVTGSDQITVTLSAGQIADGFTTAHIVGFKPVITGDTVVQLFQFGIIADIGTAVTFLMSGNEVAPGAGHQITIYLEK